MVYAKVLAGCGWGAEPPEWAVLRGALPAGGISVSPQVDLILPQRPLLAAGTQPTALEQGVWRKECEAQGQTQGARSFTFFFFVVKME